MPAHRASSTHAWGRCALAGPRCGTIDKGPRLTLALVLDQTPVGHPLSTCRARRSCYSGLGRPDKGLPIGHLGRPDVVQVTLVLVKPAETVARNKKRSKLFTR